MKNNYIIYAHQLYEDLKKTIGIVANSLHPVVGQDFSLTKIPLNLDDYVNKELFYEQLVTILDKNKTLKDKKDDIIQLVTGYIDLINQAQLYYIGETDKKIINARIALFVFKAAHLDELKTLTNSHQNKTE